MSKIRQKVFITVMTNIIIFLVVLGVFSLSFSNKIVTVLNIDSPRAIYRGNTENKNISLMINVYWGTEYIPEILDILDEYHVKCTFFIGGSWAQKNADVLLSIKDRGHELGNHGYFHKDHKNLNIAKNKEEITVCEKVVEQITGAKTRLFAPPSGSFNNTTLKVAHELEYKTIMWSKDTIDWRDKNSDLVYTRATKDIKNGDLVLMHPTEHTLKALARILQFYEDNGFHQVTVTENLQ